MTENVRITISAHVESDDSNVDGDGDGEGGDTEDDGMGGDVESAIEGDGMGGGRTDKEWVDIATEIMARYSPQGTTVVQQDSGEKVRSPAFCSVHPRDVGRLDDDSGEYVRDERLRPGIDRRVTIHRGNKESRRRSIDTITEVPGVNGRVPSKIQLELEEVT